MIDPAERVLLLAGKDDAGRPFWFTPGGGQEASETTEATLRRELREETGLVDVALGAELWRRRGAATWGGITYDCRERCFLARVAAFAPETSGFTELERREIAGVRWWSVEELATATDRLVPGSLAELVRAVLRDGPPPRPLILET